MVALKSLLLLLVPLALAAPAALPEAEAEASPAPLEARQAATTCGKTSYTLTDVQRAVNAACSYYRQGGQAGGSTYPHTYNNYEGFRFKVSGPYQEFPLLKSVAYSGGSPGADRVIINTSCGYAGAITHTGASSTNGFVGCTGTS